MKQSHENEIATPFGLAMTTSVSRILKKREEILKKLN
jgi:hypothetical protein